MSLYNQMNYKSPYPYIINTFINEYDIKAANINALLSEGMIDRDEYNRYMSMPKKHREIEIGLLSRKDSSVYKTIKKGIIHAKKQLFESNNIDDTKVLSIKNDAVFVMGDPLEYTVFGNYEFKLKNTYNVFLRLDNLEIYYGILPDSGLINIDVKGISDSKLPLHQYGILTVISTVCDLLYRYNHKEAIKYCVDTCRRYLNKQLPYDYYREFDSRSMYRICTRYQSFYFDTIDEELFKYVDLNRNLIIFRHILYILSTIHPNMR